MDYLKLKFFEIFNFNILFFSINYLLLVLAFGFRAPEDN